MTVEKWCEDIVATMDAPGFYRGFTANNLDTAIQIIRRQQKALELLSDHGILLARKALADCDRIAGGEK